MAFCLAVSAGEVAVVLGAGGGAGVEEAGAALLSELQALTLKPSPVAVANAARAKRVRLRVITVPQFVDDRWSALAGHTVVRPFGVLASRPTFVALIVRAAALA